MKYALLCLLLLPNLGFGNPVDGLTFEEPIIERAGLLRPSEQATLNQLLRRIHQAGGPQIGIVLLDSLGGDTIEGVSIQIADKWKLGNANRDDGALIVVAKQERRVRIEVGQGLEGDLPDAYAKRIIDYRMTPAFKQGEYGNGLVAAVLGILEYVDPDLLDRLQNAGDWQSKRRSLVEQPASPLRSIIKLIIMGLMFYFFVFTKVGRLLLVASLFSGGRGRRGGGGFGGGGFGGGGGGFSGGGASGGW